MVEKPHGFGYGNEALLVELLRIRDEDDRQNKRIAAKRHISNNNLAGIYWRLCATRVFTIRQKEQRAIKGRGNLTRRSALERGYQKKALVLLISLVSRHGNGAYLY